METFSALLAFCAGNSPVHGEFPAQRPVTRSFDVFYDLRLNKRLSKQSWGWWSETPSSSLWRHRNASIGTWQLFKVHLCVIYTHFSIRESYFGSNFKGYLGTSNNILPTRWHMWFYTAVGWLSALRACKAPLTSLNHVYNIYGIYCVSQVQSVTCYLCKVARVHIKIKLVHHMLHH